MDSKQVGRIEELLLLIPTKMCRKMDARFINVILKDISSELAKHHFMILRVLQEKEKFYVTEIVKKLGITKSQMTASVDNLIKLDFIERGADPKDRRKIYIMLTKSGMDITEKINRRLKKCLEKDIEVLSKEELNDLEKGLTVLAKFCSLNEL